MKRQNQRLFFLAVFALLLTGGSFSLYAIDCVMPVVKNTKRGIRVRLRTKSRPDSKGCGRGISLSLFKGDKGDTGATGPAGPLLSTLSTAETVRGAYSVGGKSSDMITPISFPFPLGSTPTINFIAEGVQPPSQCPGTVDAPEAAPGNLCVYEKNSFNKSSLTILDLYGTIGKASTHGAQVQLTALNTNFVSFSAGTWAVTAP